MSETSKPNISPKSALNIAAERSLLEAVHLFHQKILQTPLEIGKPSITDKVKAHGRFVSKIVLGVTYIRGGEVLDFAGNTIGRGIGLNVSACDGHSTNDHHLGVAQIIHDKLKPVGGFSLAEAVVVQQLEQDIVGLYDQDLLSQIDLNTLHHIIDPNSERIFPKVDLSDRIQSKPKQ
jgi:hypothetical protein